ncbi:helix-turn-helix domain-containing protein [Rhodococcus aetherivorans]|uniref:helix-turn-helix domain-containing protein n=1 Tax=Rhodococcus aetherivorans TaxID=191292 RepID=UPI00366F4844
MPHRSPTEPCSLSVADLRTHPSPYFTRSQVAQILDIDVRTVSRMIERGDLTARRGGRKFLILKEPFLQWLGLTSA